MHSGVSPHVQPPSRIFRIAAVVLLLLVVALIPPAIAGMATAPAEPISFRHDPIAGYAFTASVASQSARGAHASSPGRALAIARRTWGVKLRATGGSILRVELLYLPGHMSAPLEASDPGTASARHASIDPSRPLIWQVLGRSGDFGPTHTIGLIDFTSGQIVWSSPEMAMRGDS